MPEQEKQPYKYKKSPLKGALTFGGIFGLGMLVIAGADPETRNLANILAFIGTGVITGGIGGYIRNVVYNKLDDDTIRSLLGYFSRDYKKTDNYKNKHLS